LDSLIGQNLTLTVDDVKERALSIYNNTLHSKLNNTPQKVFSTLKILKIESLKKNATEQNLNEAFQVSILTNQLALKKNEKMKKSFIL
jgi:hypothetical protein